MHGAKRERKSIGHRMMIGIIVFTIGCQKIRQQL